MSKQALSIGVAILTLLLLYPKFPGFVTGVLGFVLLLLAVNKWDGLKGYFQ